MRERSTWQPNSSETTRQAATSRQADIYEMNQEHPQPSPTDYESGSPDSWAETPVSGDKMSVNDEYDGDAVKRDEIGLGEFRDDTWKHKDSDKWGGTGKYDNAKVAAGRKAMAAERIARAMLRTANDALVEETALDLMAMPDKVMVATLRRLDKASVGALPQDARLRRSLACAKLAARTLGPAGTELHVERLAATFMKVDDVTLKDMLKIVASVPRVAQQEQQQEEEEEEEEEGGEGGEGGEGATSQEQEEEEEEEEQATAAPAAPEPPAQAQQGQQEQQQVQGQQQEQVTAAPAAPAPACLPANEMQLLDEMLKAEMAEHAAPAGGDDLTALFEATPVPMGPPPAAPAGVPAMAAEGGVGISFDDDEEEGRTASTEGDLDGLFADDPEVQAQRQIKASEAEQAARVGGFQTVGRTASANGVKKIGQVRKTASASIDQTLENLWDRP